MADTLIKAERMKWNDIRCMFYNKAQLYRSYRVILTFGVVLCISPCHECTTVHRKTAPYHQPACLYGTAYYPSTPHHKGDNSIYISSESANSDIRPQNRSNGSRTNGKHGVRYRGRGKRGPHRNRNSRNNDAPYLFRPRQHPCPPSNQQEEKKEDRFS